jgi:hypothetical protein
MRAFVEVFRHQQPFVVEMAMEELRKKDINCFMQEGAVTGLEMSPVCPVAAPGIEYVLYVHRSFVQEAKQIIDDLPIDKELLMSNGRRLPIEKGKDYFGSTGLLD